MRWEGITVQDTLQQQRLLHNISFAVHRGEMVACVGESGSGKSLTASVMLDCCASNIAITAGSVTFADAQPRVTRQIGWVPQQVMSCFPPWIPIRRFIRALRVSEDHFLQWAQKLDLDVRRVLTLTPERCSGGMLQRIALAIVFARRCPWIIADEGTSALDADRRQWVREAMRHYQRQTNAGVLWITHHTEETVEVDRIVRFVTGRCTVEERGCHGRPVATSNAVATFASG